MGTLNLGKTYIGLTDDPARRKGEHGHPAGWHQTPPFPSEANARAWEQTLLEKDCVGGTGRTGWRFGYWYTIGWDTVE